MVFIPPTEFHRLGKEHWSCSGGSRWPDCILRHFMLGFTHEIDVSTYEINSRECPKSFWYLYVNESHVKWYSVWNVNMWWMYECMNDDVWNVVLHVINMWASDMNWFNPSDHSTAACCKYCCCWRLVYGSSELWAVCVFIRLGGGGSGSAFSWLWSTLAGQLALMDGMINTL